MAWLSLLLPLFATTLQVATPVGYAAVGATFSERAGVINVGLEGIMLIAAFTGVYTSYVTGHAWLGVLSAAVVGGLVGAVLAVVCVTFRGNQIIAGFGLNILALGLTRFLLEVVWGSPGPSPSVKALNPIQLPVIGHLPVLGTIFNQQGALLYLLMGVVIVSQLMLTRTRFGRRLSAVGNAPDAAEAAGMNVRMWRYLALIISGVLAGLGGVSLSLGALSFFVQGLTAGRGFIALAANILGGWSAVGSFLAALLFGAAEAVQITLPNHGIHFPQQLLSALPYVVTVIVLAGFFRKSRAPLQLGEPF